MFVFRLTEVTVFGSNVRYFTILGKVIDTCYRDAQLYLLSNKNFDFDQSIQIRHDGIYYLLLNKTNLPSYVTDLDLFQHSTFYEQTISSGTPDDIHLPIDTTASSLIYPNELLDFISRVEKEKNKTNYMFTNFCMRDVDFVFNTSSSSLLYSNFPSKRLYLGQNDLPTGYDLTTNFLYFGIFLRKMSRKFVAFNTTVFLPMTTNYFELYKYTIKDNTPFIEKIIQVIPKANHFYICDDRSPYLSCCATKYEDIQYGDSGIISPTEDGHVGVSFTIVITTGKVVVKQIPVFSTNQEHKIIDINKEPFVSSGFISNIKNRNMQPKNIDSLFMTKII